eukprot:TRINITY_DN9431_c0_g2_i1.p1 TRINITY_DN9431_c0_g2~~TRINITY_DN9431_c0_g2_i1.p1  ORF type:complete len:2131 (+),score=591.16 TRINITY_DN9431_c0_g2_i1:72-6464(+)
MSGSTTPKEGEASPARSSVTSQASHGRQITRPLDEYRTPMFPIERPEERSVRITDHQPSLPCSPRSRRGSTAQFTPRRSLSIVLASREAEETVEEAARRPSRSPVAEGVQFIPNTVLGAADPVQVHALHLARPDKHRFKTHKALLSRVALEHRSLFLFGRSNPVRNRVFDVVHHQVFEGIVILLIFANCVFLAMEDPTQDTQPAWLGVMELFFMCAFLTEMLMKVFAMGFVMHPGSYLRNGWNRLDFLIVAMSILALFPFFGNYSAIRTLRVLRPLRSINGIQGLKNIVNGLLGSVRKLVNVLLLAAFLLAILGILGVWLWAGIFGRRCQQAMHDDGVTPCARNDTACGQTVYLPGVPLHVDEGWERYCRAGATEVSFMKLGAFLGRPCDPGYVCVNTKQNPNMGYTSFDNFLWAFLAIFQCITMEGWVEIMYIVQDVWSTLGVFYFILLIVLGSFLILNLALAVINEEFIRIRKEAEEERWQAIKDMQSALLAAGEEMEMQQQEQWLEHIDDDVAASAVVSNSSGRRLSGATETFSGAGTGSRPGAAGWAASDAHFGLEVSQAATTHKQDGMWRRFRWFCFFIVTQPKFQTAVIFCISINTILLACEHHEQPTAFTDMLKTANIVLTSIFAAEMALKIAASGLRGYMEDTFNVLDGTIVILSVAELALESLSFPSFSVFRAFRLLRVFKLLKNFPELRNLIKVILHAVSDTGYLNLIILLYLFIAALVGMQFFGGKFDFPDRDEQPRATFNSFGYSFLTVFTIMTRDDWVNVMWDAMQVSSWASSAYFIILVLCGDFLILNLFLAILIGSFGDHSTSQEATDDDSDGENVAPPDGPSKSERMRASVLGDPVVRQAAMLLESSKVDGSRSLTRHLTGRELRMSIALSQLSRHGTVAPRRSRPAGDTLDVAAKSFKRSPSPGSLRRGTEARAVSDNGSVSHDFLGVSGDHILVSPQAMTPMTAPHTPLAHIHNVASSHGGSHAGSRTFGRGSLKHMHHIRRDSDIEGLELLQAADPVLPHPADTYLCEKCGDNQFHPTLPTDDHALEVHKRICEKVRLRKDRAWRLHRMQILVDQCRAQGEPTSEALEEVLGLAWEVGLLLDFSVADLMAKASAERMAEDDTADFALREWLRTLQTAAPDNDTLLSEWNRDETRAVRRSLQLLDGWSGAAEVVASQQLLLDLRVGEEILGRGLASFAQSSLPQPFRTNGGNSCALFGPDNPIRVAAYRLVKHPSFDMFILCCICLSSLLMGVENPRFESPVFVKRADNTFTVIFFLEMSCKIVALGFLFGEGEPDQPYLRDSWNIMDGCIVVVSVLSLVLEVLGGSSSLGVLKVFRTLRTLRPLRVIARNRGLRMVVVTLIRSIRSIGNVALICLLVFLVFGILGVQFFAGKLYHCTDATIRHRLSCRGWYPGEDGWTKRQWQNKHPQLQYDDIRWSLLTLFEISTLEMWSEIMWDAVDGVSSDETTQRNYRPGVTAFFVVFVVVGAFFILNLFVGVVIHHYNEVKTKEDGLHFLTREQKLWIDTQRMMLNFTPIVRMAVPTGRVRLWFFNICNMGIFEGFIGACILLNVLVMGLEHDGQTSTFVLVTETLNRIFTGVFFAEAVMKITAFGLSYFLDPWNRFDFFLVVASIVNFMFTVVLTDVSSVDASILGVMRIFRIMRVLRLVKAARDVRMLLETVWYSLPSIANIGGFLGLLFFIYATLGVDRFAMVKRGEGPWGLTYHANFENFPNAALLLFRIVTGENWNAIMHDTMVQPPLCGGDKGGCGVTWEAPVYYISFLMMAGFVLTNLFVAIILDNFATTINIEKSDLHLTDLHLFIEIWADFDPNAGLTIPTRSLPKLLERLGPPLGISKLTSRVEILNRNRSYCIPEHGGVVHFIETIIPLARHVMNNNWYKQINHKDLRSQEESWRLAFPDINELKTLRFHEIRCTTAHYFASAYIAAAYRRRQARLEVARRRLSFYGERFQWSESIAVEAAEAVAAIVRRLSEGQCDTEEAGKLAGLRTDLRKAQSRAVKMWSKAHGIGLQARTHLDLLPYAAALTVVQQLSELPDFNSEMTPVTRRDALVIARVSAKRDSIGVTSPRPDDGSPTSRRARQRQRASVLRRKSASPRQRASGQFGPRLSRENSLEA